MENYEKPENYLFRDTKFEREFFLNLVQEQISPSVDYFLRELPSSWVCPNDFFKDHIVYIRFLYRVLALSYLFEGIENFKMNLKQNSQAQRSCSVNWKKLFDQCQPKTEDMSRFLKRAKFLISQYL